MWKKKRSLPDFLILFLIVLLFYPHQSIATTTISYENLESKDINDFNSPVDSFVDVFGLKSSLSSSAVVTIQTWVAHTYNYDLVIRLYGPNGNYITLSYREGGEYDNIFNGTLFTDSASNSVSTYNFKKNGVVSPLKPEEKLSYFRGKNPNGQWKLRIYDLYSADDGSLNGFTLNIQDDCLTTTPCENGANWKITYSPTTKVIFEDTKSRSLNNPNPSAIESVVTFSELNTPISSYALITVQIWLTHPVNGNCEIRLYAPDGSYIILSNKRGGNNENIFNGTLFTDSASASNWVSTYHFSNNVVANSLKPEQSFSNFIGKYPNGQWKLWINDTVGGSNGILSKVVLQIQDGCLIGTLCGDGTCSSTSITNFTCECPIGYGGVGCLDINECQTKSDNCHPSASCTNTQGSFSCTCPLGYFGDGTNCSKCTTSNPCPICSLIDGITLVCSKQESLILYGSRTIESLFEVKGLNFPLSPYATITLQIWLSTSDPDQTIRLYGPDGSYITLSNQRGSSYEDVFDGTLFTDSASNSVSTYKFSKDGVVSPLRPEQPFSNFIDENPNGQWKLRIGSLQGIFLIGVGKLDGFIFNIKDGCLSGNPCGNGTCISTGATTFTCECPIGYDGVGCLDTNECNLGIDNCHPFAICTNTLGSFSCQCKSGYFGDGFFCSDDGGNTINVAIPIVREKTSNLISISWNPSPNAIGYQVGIVNSFGDLTSNVTLSSTITNYTFANLNSNSLYRMRLFTQVSSTSSSYFRDVTSITYPSPVSGIIVEQLNYHSITLSMIPSLGAISYSAKLFDQNQNLLATRPLQIFRFDSGEGETRLRTTINDLLSNQNYTIRIFANPETVGINFNFLTFPAPPLFLQSARLNMTTLELSWKVSEGATRYRLTQKIPDGTLISSNDFGNINSTIVYNLVQSIEYIFTIYSGNEIDFDLSEGRTMTLSTDMLQCHSIIEGNAYWPPTISNQTTGGYCNEGYGGSPFRKCLDTNGTVGNFDEIQSPCVQFPEPVSTIQVIAKSDSVIISWDIPMRATKYHVYLIVQETLIPINDGAGLDVSTNHVTIHSLTEGTNYTILIYSGNDGGFEMVGKTIQFQTPISPPSNLIVEIGSTWVYLSWNGVSLATSYSIVVQSITKRSETEFTAQTGTSFNVTSLQPETQYTITVYSTKNGIKEPFGSSIQITTLSTTSQNNHDTQNETDGPGGMIAGIIIGLLVLISLIIGIVFYLKHRTKEGKDKESQSQIELKDLNHKSESTLLNTSLEISIPGFLHLDSKTQIRVEKKLGSGGSGLVYAGVLLDPELISQHKTDKIALKQIPNNLKYSVAENDQQFFQEISVMWACSFHPNVIKLIGYTTEPEKYIITKLYDIDLFQFIHHPNEDLSHLLALKLTSDISKGMTSIQELGIIHHDLKSANVLLDQFQISEGKYVLIAIICDFGLAKVDKKMEKIENQQFQEYQGLSIHYAPPEAFNRTRLKKIQDFSIEAKEDVYSLSIIIWEMLTRKFVWEGLPNHEIEMKVRTGERPPIPKVDNSEPGTKELIELMKQCWNEDPLQRPTFQEISSKLDKML